MRYISLDLETTDLDEKVGQIIEIGIVFVDTETDTKKTFYSIVENDVYSGSAYAINLNSRIFKELKEGKNKDIIHIDNLPSALSNFFLSCGYSFKDNIFVAGKNVSTFDFKFMKEYINKFIDFRFSHRTIDPSILFLDYFNDKEVPNLEECKKRAEFENTEVAHNALDDAWDIVNLLEKYYKK